MNPATEWRCFYCGETFTEHRSAADHFGEMDTSTTACLIKGGGERGLLEALRKSERELSDAWGMIHSEGAEAATAYRAQTTRHREQLIAAEQTGYDRGLSDARDILLTDRPTIRDDVVEAVEQARGSRHTHSGLYEGLTQAAAALRATHKVTGGRDD